MKNLVLLSFLIAFLSLQCKVDPLECVCIEIYAPVCGTDGVVYENSCLADCAGVESELGFCPEDVVGVVKFEDPAVDGCGWILNMEFGDVIGTYRPQEELPEEFKEDGLNVSLTVRRLLDSEPCGFGNIDLVEVIAIDKI